MLHVIMLIVIMLHVITLGIIMLNVIMLDIILLSVIILNVIMLSVILLGVILLRVTLNCNLNGVMQCSIAWYSAVAVSALLTIVIGFIECFQLWRFAFFPPSRSFLKLRLHSRFNIHKNARDGNLRYIYLDSLVSLEETFFYCLIANHHNVFKHNGTQYEAYLRHSVTTMSRVILC